MVSLLVKSCNTCLFFFFLSFCSVSADKKLHKRKIQNGGETVSFFVPFQKIFQTKILSGRCDKLATWSHAGLRARAGGRDHAATVLCRRETWGDEISGCGVSSGAPSHVSTGLGTILLGVSGNCDDRDVTSLPEEFPREPDSEKDTWTQGEHGSHIDR